MCFPHVKTVSKVKDNHLELTDGHTVIGDPGIKYRPGDQVEVMGAVVVQKISRPQK